MLSMQASRLNPCCKQRLPAGQRTPWSYRRQHCRLQRKAFLLSDVTVAFRCQPSVERCCQCAAAEIHSSYLPIQVVSNTWRHQRPLPAPADVSAYERVPVTVSKVIWKLFFHTSLSVFYFFWGGVILFYFKIKAYLMLTSCVASSGVMQVSVVSPISISRL